MRRLKSRRLNKRAFTLIELIVVIAAIGILVLLAAPKFLGYTKAAKVAQIQNDIRAMENAVEVERIKDDDFFSEIIDDGETINKETLEGYKNDNSLFNKRGVVKDSDSLEGYYEISSPKDLVKTKLKGQFYVEKSGEVLYYEKGMSGEGDSNNESEGENEGDNQTPSTKTFTVTFEDRAGEELKVVEVEEGESAEEHAPRLDKHIPDEQDIPEYSEFQGWDKDLTEITEDITTKPVYKSVFEWVKQGSTGQVNSDNESGYFKYVGTGQSIVEIPHAIQGAPVTSYHRMFYQTSEDVQQVVSTNDKVTNMSSMFYGSQARTLDLSNFNTNNVTNMSGMFNNSQATSLDLSNFNTSNVTNMYSLFKWTKAEEIIGLDKFDTSKVTDMSSMFEGAKPEKLDLSNFNTNNVTNMSSMFWDSQARTLDLSNFNTTSVTDMSYMFYNSQAAKLDLSSFNTSNVTDMSYMFLNSLATEGYARTQADANKFNSSSKKPSGLTFQVK